MRNNHPLLGICCKYRLNPIGVMQRITMLVGSIALGVAITNFVYLYFRFYRGVENEILFEIKIRGSSDGNGDGDDANTAANDNDNGEGISIFEVSSETVVLWTLGSLVHSLVDFTVWHLAACACCLPGACCSCCGCLRTLGRYLTICLCAVFVALATSAIIMRGNFDEARADASAQGSAVNATVDDLTEIKLETFNSAYTFLVGYCGELVVVYFITFPIVATIFFMGLLPCTGGRSSEIKRQRDEEAKRCQNCDHDYNDDDDDEPLYG